MIEPEEARRTGEDDGFEMDQQRVHGRRRALGRATDSVADANDGAGDAATSQRDLVHEPAHLSPGPKENPFDHFSHAGADR